jgi:MoxR-like ATPase
MTSLNIARRLTEEVLEPMKRDFVGKDEIIDLLGVCLVGGENLFIMGPPGTAKSALVHSLSARLDGQTFDYLLTRFTEPNELFGPFDIRKLREGELLTNTEGMLPEASLVFLDELLNANSAILNSLLTALNERVFRRGKETRDLKALMFVGASNHLPEEDALQALFDRFLLRVQSANVAGEELPQVLEAGWKLNQDLRGSSRSALHFDDVRTLHELLRTVDLSLVRQGYSELIQRIRYAGIPISDRRAVKLQGLIAASAILCERMSAQISDLWVLRYIWDTEEQQEVLRALVQQVLAKVEAAESDHHRARSNNEPDAESLARDLEYIATHVEGLDKASAEASYLRDRLGILNGRCQWIVDREQREFLTRRVAELWPRFDK